LVLQNIPYKVFGGVRFYERREIKDILAYLKVINNPKDSVSLLRIINVPRRGIGDTTIDKLYDYATSHDIALYDVFSSLEDVDGIGSRIKKLNEFIGMINSFIEYSKEESILNILNNVLETTNYIGELEAEKTEEAQGRIENIDEFISKAAQFEEEAEDKSLTSFLEELALVADIDGYEENDDYVALMTFHSSKGLEFPCVFMVGLEENVFPSYRSLISPDSKELEEERRICYVGITRAKEMLHMSCAATRRQHGSSHYNPRSRFVSEISENLMENVNMSNENENTKKERTGISQFAEINKVKNSIDISFGGKNYLSQGKTVDSSKSPLEFDVGDKVKQMKYGVGTVTDIKDAGADYEVTVEFDGGTAKKFMAKLSKLKKVEG
jgi:DNA helicase-2/ATP-dependent DNA helicase PcrA